MNRSAIVIVIVAVIAGVKAGDINDPKVKAVADKCAAAEHPTPADIEALKAHSTDLTKEAKCMIACMMKEFGVLSADGKPQKEVFMMHAQEETKGDAGQMKHANEIFDTCAGSSVADVCETSFLFSKCVMEEMIKRGMPMVM